MNSTSLHDECQCRTCGDAQVQVNAAGQCLACSTKGIAAFVERIRADERDIMRQEEQAWLIERKFEGHQEYWTGRPKMSWSQDVNDAVRCARRTDAELFAHAYVREACEVLQHGWAPLPLLPLGVNQPDTSGSSRQRQYKPHELRAMASDLTEYPDPRYERAAHMLRNAADRIGELFLALTDILDWAEEQHGLSRQEGGSRSKAWYAAVDFKAKLNA